MNDRIKQILPYVYVLAAFSIFLFALVWTIDSIFLPKLVRDAETAKVPSVIGKTQAEAEDAIAKIGLQFSKQSDQYSESVPSGSIINQIPKPDELVKKGRTIYLIVSKGKETVNAPFLVGQPLRTAKVSIMNMGLEVGKIEYDNSLSFGADTIISQRPASGKPVPYGGKIDIVVSKGQDNQVKIPQLIGSTLDEAKSLILQSELVLGNSSFLKHETFASGVVINQNPPPGTLVNKGTTVDIIISK
jgi:beta-lactam-binding protein with PASTA domain